MTLYHQAADMLERAASTLDEEMVRGCQQDIADMNALAAELRAAAALDELVRENERLGLYDDQRPVAWRCRDYVTGCWFISVKPDPAGSIAGESVPLYAAPSPAQPRQPLSDGEADAILRSVGVLANAHSEFLREIVRATERAITRAAAAIGASK